MNKMLTTIRKYFLFVMQRWKESTEKQKQRIVAEQPRHTPEEAKGGTLELLLFGASFGGKILGRKKADGNDSVK